MNVSKPALIVIVCFVLSTFALAQKNELSFSVGAMHSSDQTETITFPGFPPTFPPITNSTDIGVLFEANYARELFNFGAASLDVELPVVLGPGRGVKITTLSITSGTVFTNSPFFFTPSARIKFLHSSPISPWVSVGGGLAHFAIHFSLPTGTLGGVPVQGSGFSFSDSTNHGALQFGGGVDFKTPLRRLAVRVEVRDFWAVGITQPGPFVQVSPEHQHNIFAAGGVVLHF